MSKKLKKNLMIVGLLMVIIQVIPVKRDNPESLVGGEIDTDKEIEIIFKTSCYDCHSNQTKWPWYGYVAPVSWMVAHHVKEAREHLNFSTWNTLTREKRQKAKEEIWEEVEEGNMPMPPYAFMHPEVKVGSREQLFLKKWAEISE